MLTPIHAAMIAAFAFSQPALSGDGEGNRGWKVPFNGGGGAVIVENVIYV